jgi:CRISPR-associated protein Csb2
MFALSVHLLAGRYVATAYNDRTEAEWPPHAARLYSALVATWADGGGLEAEAEALDWLATLPAPQILASAANDVARRTVAPVFVPVNDAGVVGQPDDAELASAEAALMAEADSRERQRLTRRVEQLRRRFVAVQAKAIAAPARISAGESAAGRRVLPEHRTRQPRTFPSITPSLDAFAYVWQHEDVPAHLAGVLAALLARVVRLGHSSSFVRVSLASVGDVARLEAATARYVPDPDEGRWMLRWVDPNQRSRLVEAYERHREIEPRVLPASFVRYREGGRLGEPSVPTSVFGEDWLVFARIGGPRLTSVATAGIARQFRRALIAAAEEPVAEVISGHQSGGAASERPHAAIVPLSNVAIPHADGSLLGVAIVLPRTISSDERRAVMAAIARLEAAQQPNPDEEAPVIPLVLGAPGVLHLRRIVWGEHERVGLRARTWCGWSPARCWATATPVALDRNPGDLHDPDPARRAAAFVEATAGVVQALERIGLPAPRLIDVLRSAVLPGTAKPRQFPRFPETASRPQRVLVHVRLEFAQPVRGPIVAGAGRYLGLGLFRPVDRTGRAN